MKNKFEMVNSEGELVEYLVLLTYDSEDTGKSYVVYTDQSFNENGEIILYASTYTPDHPDRLGPIETEWEWKMIEVILEETQQAVRGDGTPG